MSNKLLLSVILTLPFTLLGYGFPASQETGTSLVGLDPVTASVGGVSSLDIGGSAVMLNPSGLALIGKTRVQVGIGSVLSKESVETPYGRFNISTIALGSVGFTAAFPIGRSLGTGVGICRLSDFSYKGEFYDFVIQGADSVVIFEQQNNSGSVWEASAGLGATLVNGLHAGASVGYRFGSGTDDYFRDTSVDSPLVVIETWDENAVSYRAGLTATLSRFMAGVAFTNGMEKYPSRVSLGAVIGNMTRWEPSVGAEIELQFPGDSTRFAGRLFGGTLISGNDLYARASVFIYSSQGRDTKEGTGFSMGISLKAVEKLCFDAALSWTSESRTGNVFGGYNPQSTVTDTNTGITAGITWNP